MQSLAWVCRQAEQATHHDSPLQLISLALCGQLASRELCLQLKYVLAGGRQDLAFFIDSVLAIQYPDTFDLCHISLCLRLHVDPCTGVKLQLQDLSNDWQLLHLC